MIMNKKGFVLTDDMVRELTKIFNLTIFELYERLQNEEMELSFETKHKYLTGGNSSNNLALHPTSIIVRVKFNNSISEINVPYEVLKPLENLSTYYIMLNEQINRLQ